MFIENLRDFIKYYAKGRKIKLAGFGIISLIAGFMEFIGVALIYPFIMLIIQPDAVHISKYIHIENSTLTGLLVGLAVLLIFIIKNAFMIFTQYIQNAFVINWRNSLVNNFMNYFLFAPYKYTMRLSASDKLFIISTLCSQAIECFLMRILNLLTNVIIIFMVITLLMLKFLVPALITILFVSITAYIQNKFFKSRTTEIAKFIAQESKDYQNYLLENINNVKEIKILGSEKIFFDNFKKSLSNLSKLQVKQGFLLGIPSYIVEILVVFSLIIMAGIISIKSNGQSSNLIASFAIITASLFRIAPALNRIQSAAIAINTSRNYVKLLNKEYDKYDYKPVNFNNNEILTFEKSIKFENINFSYNDEKKVIENVSFEINKGDFIGIIGLSGAGKSTLADILTGILPVDSGKIYLDQKELSEKDFYNFRKLIGYVPQQINILDKSIRENVAWGCENIDDEQVIKVLQDAQIYDAIRDIYANFIVGSNGLSQGQKQRIAIARALYRNPEILILDEATSALDVKTENEITQMLSTFRNRKTIIAIAHRLSTLKACNKLIYLKDGKVIDIGTFEELAQRYDDFNNLIKLSKID